jgi:plastocyanin domain-containing protein
MESRIQVFHEGVHSDFEVNLQNKYEYTSHANLTYANECPKNEFNTPFRSDFYKRVFARMLSQVR